MRLDEQTAYLNFYPNRIMFRGRANPLKFRVKMFLVLKAPYTQRGRIGH